MSYQFGHVDPEERLDHAEQAAPEDGDYAPRRFLPAALVAIGVMTVFAGGLWFAYHAGEKHAAGVVAAPSSSTGTTGNTGSQVPLIRADTEPVKVKPEKAGGMNIPDKDDPIYSLHPSANVAEHILPPPEVPAPRPTAPPPAPPVQTAASPATSTPKIEPGPAPAPPDAAQRAVPKPAPPAAKPVAAGPPVRIQLASLRTPDQAREEWARLKHDNSDLLGKFTAVAARADLGERGIWYRVEAGPVGDRAAALKLCKALQERGLECQLVQ